MMKREEKNALTRQRIEDAAMAEFSRKGYDMASLNTVCAENQISKGIIYHYYKDKDTLYLMCVGKCFDELTAALRTAANELTGTAEQRLRQYFDARLRFFAENQTCLGLFADAVFLPPEQLASEIAICRQEFDELNISVLTGLLQNQPLREGLSAASVVEDFGIYMDYFNLHFRTRLYAARPAADLLREHEERCHRQLRILLHGVLEESDV